MTLRFCFKSNPEITLKQITLFDLFNCIPNFRGISLSVEPEYQIVTRDLTVLWKRTNPSKVLLPRLLLESKTGSKYHVSQGSN